MSQEKGPVKKRPRLTSNSDSDQVAKDAELFSAIRRKPKRNQQISEEDRLQDIKEYLDEGANINAIDKNEKDNSVLHIAIQKGYKEIVKFLLAKGATIDITNNEGKTPLDIAKDENDQDLIKLLIKSANIPADGNCLFWAVALAYLTPVKNDDNLLQDRFDKLFGRDKLQDLPHVRVSIQNYNPFVSQKNIISDKILNGLITQQFRSKVVAHMQAKESDFKQFIEGESGLTFDKYLDRMNVPGEWGGEPEIKAMSQMLECRIQVHSAATTSIYGAGNDMMKLYCDDLLADPSGSGDHNHYNFELDAKFLDSTDLSSMYSSSRVKRKAEGSESPLKKSKSIVADESQSISTADIKNDNDAIPIVKKSDTFENEPSEYSSSGLKLSLHGTIYQLKLLMLFLKRGLGNEYSFRLATEMDEAEKFDDLVFQYAKKDDTEKRVKDNQGNTVFVYRFLQAKHKQDEKKQITYNDLCTENTDGEFSLPKYFTSYCKIKQKHELSKHELKDFILCTNINFDFEKLKEAGIETNEITEPDDFLEMKSVGKTAIRYKLTVNDQHELYEKLKATSDSHILSKALVEHIKDKKQIDLKNPIFKSYHMALVLEKVIVVEEKEKEKGKKEYIGKFHEKFLNYNPKDLKDPNNDPGLSESVKNLRKILQEQLDKVKGLSIDKDTELKLSSTFGKGFELDLNPQLTKVEDFAQELATLIIGAKKAGEDITVERRKQIIKDNIDKLAGHVLVEKDKKVQFSSKFLDVNKNLPSNLEDFRKELKNKLENEKIDFSTLVQYQFKIDNFFTCEEEKLHLKPKLPEDDIDNKEIDDFFDKLVFAVNQPNEIELGNIIKEEIGEECNLIDSDFIADYIQKEMLDWFKEKGEKGKEGRYFSNEDGDQLFASTKQKIAKLILISSTLEYRAKISKYDIKFAQDIIDELQLCDFLTVKNKTQIFNLVTEHNMLSAIKMYQALQDMPEYKKDDSHIFIRLSSLLHVKDRVIQAFKSKTSNLLVIECKQDKIIKESDIQGIYSQLSEIISSASSINKKIVLITKQDDVLSSLFKDDSASKYQETIDNKNLFTHLTLESQKKLLQEGKLILQGYEINLNKLIDENSKEVIDSETLMKLINNDKVIIGHELTSLGETKNYYINRTFNYEIQIKTEIFKEEKFKDLLAISGIDKASLNRLVEENKIRLFQENDPDNSNPIRIIILNNLEAEEQFKQLCLQHQQLNIHWLRSESGKLIWQQSQGAISRLRKYIEDESYTKLYSETELLNQTDQYKAVIISDTAGMGKSTIMTYIAQKLKEQNPNLWLVRINLNNYTNELKEQRAKGGFKEQDINEAIEAAIQFLAKDLLKLDTHLEQALFKHYCQHQHTGKLIVMFDGFDEISPDYGETVTDLMQVLRNSLIKQLWVTTRPTEKEGLEDKLQQFAYTLKSFSEENQIEFLKRFWQQKLEISKPNQEQQERIKIYAKALIKLLAKSISDKDTEFTGIPLQIRMLAEAFLKDFAEFYQSNEAEPKLPKELNLMDLYERFLMNKYDIYQVEKNKLVLSQPRVKIQSDKSYSKFIEQHQNLALYTLFNKEKLEILYSEKFCQEFRQLYPSLAEEVFQDNGEKKLLLQDKKKEIYSFIKDIKEGKENTGIIDEIINDKPHFIHQTFAEYLAAVFFVNSLKQPNQSEITQKFLIKNILIESDYQVIRAFINDQLIKEKIPESTLKLYGEKIAELLKLDEKIVMLPVDNKNLSNKHGDTILHIATSENNINIISFLLDSAKKHNDVLKALLETTNNKRKYTALHVSAKKGFLDILVFLLERGADTNRQDNDGRMAHHLAVAEGNIEIVRYLVEKGADVNAVDKYGSRPIRCATNNSNLEIFKYLVEKRADVNVLHKGAWTPLHWAAESGNMEIFKYLIEKGADVNMLHNYGWTPLHWAAESGNMEIFKYLVEKGADINVPGNDGRTPLCLAAAIGNLVIVKYLVEKGADVNVPAKYGWTPLYWAAERGNLEIVKYLVEKGANVNVPDKYGQTPLQSIVRSCNLEIVKYLVAKEADVNVPDNDGQSPLHSAVTSCNLEIVKYLVENGADVNVPNNDGWAPLHGAVARGNFEMVKYFVEKGANVNVPHNNGWTTTTTTTTTTPLHLAAGSCNLEIVKYLVEKGANVNVAYNNGWTPLHWATERGTLEIIKYLVEKGANVNVLHNNGWTPLHSAVRSHNLEMVKYLVAKEADVSVPYNDGQTPLHLAVTSCNLEIVKYLVENGADVNVPNNDDQTPLLSAARRDNLEIFKYLVEKVADVNVPYKDGWTPLYWAAKRGTLEIIKYLVEKGADVNVPYKDGWAPLHGAVARGNFEMVKYFVEKGANVNVPHNNGWTTTTTTTTTTPLHLAAGSCNLEIVKYLVAKGADVNVPDNDGQSPLNSAVRSHNLEIVKYLVEKGADVNVPDNDGQSPLNSAVKSHNLEIAKYLVENGADVNVPNNDGWAPLHWAAERGTLEIVKYLVEKVADVNVPYKDGWTPLHWAAERGTLEIIKYLVEKGADVNVPYKDGWAPLHGAVARGNFEMVKYLVEKGADVNVPGNDGRTPLCLAAEIGNLEIVKYLVEKGADVNVPDNDGQSPLHSAVTSCNLEIVKYLVENGANVNVPNNAGWAPLHWAAERGTLEIVKYLVEKVADVNMPYKDGWTPLYWAAKRGTLEIIKYLVEKGADVNVPYKDGWAPLHRAVARGNFEMVKYLVEKGADVNVPGNDGRTPLCLAAEIGNLEIVKYLVEKGADVNAPKYGWTPLYWAAERGNLEIVKYLVEKGADVNVSDNDDQTPLHSAVRRRNLEIVKYLVEKGADVNMPDNFCWWSL